MTIPDLSALKANAQEVVLGVGREAIEVYLFLSDEFARGSVAQNYLFQFVYRSYYQLDSAGLTDEFKSAYFQCMEDARGSSEIDLTATVTKLREFPNRKGQASLQFSFASKLAHTVNPSYPVYDTLVAEYFRFRTPYSYKQWEVRLNEYLDFYRQLRTLYENAIDNGSLNELTDLFNRVYSPAARRVPEVKILDFIFWSAGKAMGASSGKPNIER